MSSPFRPVVLGVLALANAACGPSRPDLRPATAATEPEQMHRIYDFTPVSESNPIVARVADSPVEIPLSEFQAHLKTEVTEDDRKKLTAEGKRKQLDRLIDELVLLWDAYRQKADESERVSTTLEGTKKMLLGEFLQKQDVDDKAKSSEEHARQLKVFRERLFQKASITVSNEAYAALKDAAKKQKSPTPESLSPELALRPLAQCLDHTVTIGDVWKAWAATPAEKRADLADPDALKAILYDLTEDLVKVHEALARGIDKTRPYREKVQANRAALTRMWAHDRVTKEASARLKSPETEPRLRQWYQDHLKTRYTYKDEKGNEKVMDYDAEKQSIQNDYFDELREQVKAERAKALRGDRKVEVDEQLVGGA
jgi:hypothetical protein